MRGLKLDPSTHDLTLVNASFETVDDVEAAGQEAKTRLLFFKGEYFLDVRQGVPYFTDILAKGYDESRVKSILRQAITNVPGIVDVPAISIDLNRATREASISFSARFISGAVVDFPPLLIEL